MKKFTNLAIFSALFSFPQSQSLYSLICEKFAGIPSIDSLLLIFHIDFSLLYNA